MSEETLQRTESRMMNVLFWFSERSTRTGLPVTNLEGKGCLYLIEISSGIYFSQQIVD